MPAAPRQAAATDVRSHDATLAVRARAVSSGAEDAGSSTQRIVDAITEAIVERRLMPGTKLAEQQLADIFSVSRTLVRQALNQLSRDRLVTLSPARGASDRKSVV
jgi:DNA-binding GntR family transcriptional regulator